MWRRVEKVGRCTAEKFHLPKKSLSFTPEKTDDENLPVEKVKERHEELSFQDLVSEIANGQKQSDVTISYYFICLLHLANEKVNYYDGLCINI